MAVVVALNVALKSAKGTRTLVLNIPIKQPVGQAEVSTSRDKEREESIEWEY
jgi:hypothetical protein